jgi:hypothetical protein
MKPGRIEVHVLKPAEDDQAREDMQLWVPCSDDSELADAVRKAIDFLLEQGGADVV